MIAIPLPKINLPAFQIGARSRPLRPKKARRWFDDEARPSQRPPQGEWRLWLLLAGRGFGKTRVLVEWAKEQARRMPGSRGAIVAATAADTRDVLAEGPAGFIATSPPEELPMYEPSKRRITWPNGSQATLYSADEPNRLRGPQHHWAICDEFATWRYPETLDMLMFGLRLGQDPRVVIATTPRPTKEVKALLKQPGLVLTRGTTYENLENLAPAFREQIIARYEGTRLGRQELNAELLEDVEGALWSRTLLDENRVHEASALRVVVVGVDPKASQVADSETGIVVAGIGIDGHGYVLADYSLNGSPEQWAAKVAMAYEAHEANTVVVERNNGGDMVRSVLRATGVKLPLKLVWASRGKQTRAEPIVALYEQHKIHHVGSLPGLEDEMTSWVPSESDSPDRVDAAVWALSSLMLKQQQESEKPASLSMRTY